MYIADDPKLSSKTDKSDEKEGSAKENSDDESEEEDLEIQLESIRNKLKSGHKKSVSTNHFLQRDNDAKRKKV